MCGVMGGVTGVWCYGWCDRCGVTGGVMGGVTGVWCYGWCDRCVVLRVV